MAPSEAKMDIVGELPEPLVVRILRLLSVGDLARAANVSPLWRSLVESPTFLDTLLRDKGFTQEKLVSFPSKLGGGLVEYWRGSAGVGRMRRREYREVVLPGAVEVAPLGNGAVVAVLTAAMPDLLEAFDLNASYKRSIFATALPPAATAWTLHSYPSLLICRSPNTCLLCFRFQSPTLRFTFTLFHSGLKFHGSTTYNDFKVPEDISGKAEWELVGVVGEKTVVLSTVGFYIHFFCLEAGEEVSGSLLESRIEDSAVEGDHVLLALSSLIASYNPKGEREFLLETWPLFGFATVYRQVVSANQSVILLDAAFSWGGVEHNLKAWDWPSTASTRTARTGGGDSEFLVLPPGTLRLHSSRRAVLHISHTHFSLTLLTDGSTLWKIPKQDRLLHPQVFDAGRDLAVVAREGGYSVLDLAAGEELYAADDPPPLSLKGANQKLFWFAPDPTEERPRVLLHVFAAPMPDI